MFCDGAFQRIGDELGSVVVDVIGHDGDGGVAVVGFQPLIRRHHGELVVRATLRGVAVQRAVDVKLAGPLVDAEVLAHFEAGPLQGIADVVGAVHVGVCRPQLSDRKRRNERRFIKSIKNIP